MFQLVRARAVHDDAALATGAPQAGAAAAADAEEGEEGQAHQEQKVRSPNFVHDLTIKLFLAGLIIGIKNHYGLYVSEVEKKPSKATSLPYKRRGRGSKILTINVRGHT